MSQRWKNDSKLYNCPTEENGTQVTKKLDYHTTYRKEFLECDPLRDWDSFERCKWLWEWAVDLSLQGHENASKWSVLDVGTKDCQFPEWLREQGIASLGLEYSEEYVRYAINKGRPVKYGDACNMEFDDGEFDFVFSHHLHGLLSDYAKGIDEMMRVTSRYLICLNQVPGNPKKHYSYVKTPKVYHDFVKYASHTHGEFDILYNDYLDTGFNNEWVLFVEKKQPYKRKVVIDTEKEGIVTATVPESDTDMVEPIFKKKKFWRKFF